MGHHLRDVNFVWLSCFQTNYYNWFPFLTFNFLATSVLQSDTETRLMMMEGHMAQRKIPSCIPHDIGDPGNFMQPF